MGILVAKTYPTSLFARAADHTYVECSTGAIGWSCWGGKSGGTVLRSSTGSTVRANDIASQNERAGIACYLVNGVCHQAANRVLLPAGILVTGARGYAVSHAMFGTYGRIGTRPCHAPFDRHPASSGDLPACIPMTARSPETAHVSTVADQLDWNYIRDELQLYAQHAELFAPPRSPNIASTGPFAVPRDSVEAFHLALFAHMVDYYLGPRIDAGLRDRLLSIRRDIENRMLDAQAALAMREVSGSVYVDAIDEITIDFQSRTAEVMTDGQYETLFRLTKNEQVVVADRAITQLVFGA
jgi:hypothetical protein